MRFQCEINSVLARQMLIQSFSSSRAHSTRVCCIRQCLIMQLVAFTQCHKTGLFVPIPLSMYYLPCCLCILFAFLSIMLAELRKSDIKTEYT